VAGAAPDDAGGAAGASSRLVQALVASDNVSPTITNSALEFFIKLSS
jgi:hypothetical protein